MIKPVRYIHLYNLKGSYDAFRIPELQVFVDDKEIDYIGLIKKQKLMIGVI